MIPDGTGALIKNLIHWHTHTHTHSERTYYYRTIPKNTALFSTPYSHPTMAWHDTTLYTDYWRISWNEYPLFRRDYVHYGEESWQRNSASIRPPESILPPASSYQFHTLQGLKSLSVLCYILFTWIIGNRQVTCSTSSMTMRNLAMATDHNPRTGTDTCEDPPMRLKNHDLCRFVLQRFDCLFTVLSYALSYENRFHIEVCLRKGSAKSIQLIQSSMMSLLRSAVPVMSG